jgi:GNAT superfamily N-acetyltransferase
MKNQVTTRPIQQTDYAAWKPLWDGYNAFYGRAGETALAQEITDVTWQRFLDANQPVHALVAEHEGRVVGLAHYLYHHSTIRPALSCYLSDLFTDPALRGKGVGRALIESVYAEARAAGVQRVYWQTHTSNEAGRTLYDKVASHEGFIVYSKTV